MKKVLCLLLILLMPALSLGEQALQPLPADGPAPYAPVAGAFSEDGLSYDDGTLSIRVERAEAFKSEITYVYVKCTDPSQLRTALAAKFPSRTLRPVEKIAEENNAVLAVNGDYFVYHSQGIVIRNGQELRFQPRTTRDTLIIDRNGDFTILTNSCKRVWEEGEWSSKAVQAFCFGPALIVDGVEQHFRARDKVSCGADTRAQRLAIGQLGPMEYLIIAASGPEQKKGTGLTIRELVSLAVEKGCIQAYNLDGGSSVTICLNGQRVNSPKTKNRAVGDIIYFATLREE